MGTDKVGKLLLQFGVPATIGIVVNALYNIVDSIFIGQGVGELGIAATTVAFPIMIAMMAIGMLIGGGGNALMSIRLGEGNYPVAEKILGNSVSLFFAAWVIVASLGTIFLEPMLMFVGATPEVLPYAMEYTGIILLGFLFQGIGFGVNNFIRSVGSPKRAMSTMLIGAVANIILDYLFIMVFGWGVAGAAWATVIGQALAAASVIHFFRRGQTPVKLRISALRPDAALMAKMIPLGLAPFAMQVAASGVNIILNNSLVTYGSLEPVGGGGALAAMGVVIRLAQFFVMPIMGFVMAAQPIIGFNYGARKFDRVKKTFMIASVVSTLVLVVFWAIVMLLPGALVGVFGLKDAALRDVAIYGLRAYMVLMPLIGFQMLGASYFQATGQAAKSAVLSLTRQVIFFIPALFLLPRILPGLIEGMTPLQSLLYSAPVSDLLSTILTGVFVLRELVHLDDKHAGEQEGDAERAAVS